MGAGDAWVRTGTRGSGMGCMGQGWDAWVGAGTHEWAGMWVHYHPVPLWVLGCTVCVRRQYHTSEQQAFYISKCTQLIALDS